MRWKMENGRWKMENVFKKKNIEPEKRIYKLSLSIRENLEDCVVDIDNELLEIIQLFPEQEFAARTGKVLVRFQAIDLKEETD